MNFKDRIIRAKGNTWEPDGDFTVRTVVEIDGENID